LAQTFQIAHLKQQGVDIIVVFVNDSVQHMSNADRGDLLAAVQSCAGAGGLARRVTLVWLYLGRMYFSGPTNQRAFHS